jgi:hypothetical protein
MDEMDNAFHICPFRPSRPSRPCSPCSPLPIQPSSAINHLIVFSKNLDPRVKQLNGGDDSTLNCNFCCLALEGRNVVAHSVVRKHKLWEESKNLLALAGRHVSCLRSEKCPKKIRLGCISGRRRK